MNNDDRILVTGSNGMVGQSLCKTLKGNGFENVKHFSSREVDLKSLEETKRLFYDYKPRYVFHLAAKVGGIGSNIASPVEYLQENLLININVISSAYSVDVEKLLALGSSCIYPRDCAQPMKEEFLLDGKLEPTNEGYALSKICLLKLCEYYRLQYAKDFFVLMVPNVFGAGDSFDPENSHVISALVRKAHMVKTGEIENFVLWGSGQARREFLYVDDVSSALLYFMKKDTASSDSAFLNVGYGTDISIYELAQLVTKIVGCDESMNFDHSKPDGMPKKLLDSSRSRECGWNATITLDQGLRLTYDWYLSELSS